MGVRRNKAGPLRFSKLVIFTGDDGGSVQFFSKTVIPAIKPRDDDEDHIVHIHERSDLTSSRELGTSQAAHLIMLRNETDDSPMRLWPNDWYPGRRLQIPTSEGLRSRGLL